ncbi:23S rRNA (uracil(1939)-C(5))-methyltransferase RlmD, partial [Klebsiella pneumoniae]|nr:23S rRNA (uracil(1939)-C(5))-methyltransferase RlmD [Klebsiella pneumoniae]
QHACSQLQQTSKADSLSRLISRAVGGCPELDPVICGPEYGYRRRARLGLLYQPKQQRLQMGFRQTESHDLVSVKHCPVLRPEL